MDHQCINFIHCIYTTSVSTPKAVINAHLVSTTPISLVLTCTVTIDSASDLPTKVKVTWSCGSSGVLYNSRRITVSDTEGSGPTFTSILSISPRSAADSSCTFTCRAIATPPLNFQSFSTKSAEGDAAFFFQ